MNELFAEPPESTEQVLHSEKRGDRPRRIAIDVEGYDVLGSDVIGELRWSIYFSMWEHFTEGPEIGWDGDRYVLLRRGEESPVLAFVTVWDSAFDAQVFANAFRHSLRARLGDAAGGWRVKAMADVVFVVSRGDDKLLDALVEGTSFP